jgi:hypothetical protein
VDDTWRGAVWSDALRTASIPPMTAVRLGTALPDDGFLPAELCLRAPVAVVTLQGQLRSLPGVLGYIRTAAGRMLLDPVGPTD